MARALVAATLVLGATIAQGQWVCGWTDEAKNKHYNIEALKDIAPLQDNLHDPGDPNSYTFSLSVCKNLVTTCALDGGLSGSGFFHQVRDGDGQCMGWKGQWGKEDPKLKYSALPADKDGFKLETHSGSPSGSCSEGVRKAQVIFECDETVEDDKIQDTFYVTENSQLDPDDPDDRPFCLFVAHLKSKRACPGDKPPPGDKPNSGSSGLSTGWIFFMALVIPFALYCLAGCAFKFHKGERGASMMPNDSFWRDLPSLIKDGASFTKGKIGSVGGAKAGTEYSTMDSSA